MREWTGYLKLWEGVSWPAGMALFVERALGTRARWLAEGTEEGEAPGKTGVRGKPGRRGGTAVGRVTGCEWVAQVLAPSKHYVNDE